MHARTFGRLGTVLAGVAVSAMALSGTASAVAKTIDVPGDFVASLSDTRVNGHYEVIGTGLRIYTDGNADTDSTGRNTDKVAEYVATSTPLANVGEPSLNYTKNTGTIAPGFQLVIDFGEDSTPDGILIGEPGVYGNDWWLNNAAEGFVKAGAPSHAGGFGSDNHGTLAQWRSAFPTATVTAFGFALGSGVKGDYLLNSIAFAGDTYTFTAPVVLTSKDECKKGGWAASTSPVFKNQGDCVSSFATAK
ncbi:MAG: hypothetical protein LH468_04645 [Nocardioides sp.]|nr:hypothetical protein [Nocardioides sp.]